MAEFVEMSATRAAAANRQGATRGVPQRLQSVLRDRPRLSPKDHTYVLTMRLRDGHHHHHHPDHHHGHRFWGRITTMMINLGTIGISGGLVPCPSALVLLLSAIALHQIAYGLVLIGGFSLGLASVLTSLGLAAVYGQQWLEKSPLGTGIIQRLSVVSALATVCIGLGLTTVAVMG